MEEGLGIRGGTIALFFITSYFIIKWAVFSYLHQKFNIIL